MEKNHKKGQNRKPFHLKKHRKTDDSKNYPPRPTNKEEYVEKPVLFQLGSIASYGISYVRPETDPEITTSRSASSSTSSEDIQNKDLLSLSSKLGELQGSSDTAGGGGWSEVSGVTHASLEPTLMSPSVQMMDRDGTHDQPQRNSLPTLEKNFSTVSNDSLFSLSIGENAIARDELFSYRDFKPGELLKSGELLSFCPSIHIPVDSSDLGKSFDIEDKTSEEHEDHSSNSSVSWRNIGDNSDEAPSSTQSFSYPITKKSKKKKKVSKKKTTTQQQQQKQKKRCCSWLCCKSTGPFCDYNFSCCKRLKCCSCCCSSCSWLFCCNWSCCCYSSSKKVIDDEMTIGRSEEQRLQKGHKWFCC